MKLWEWILETPCYLEIGSKSILWAELALGKTEKNTFFLTLVLLKLWCASDSSEGLLKHKRLNAISAISYSVYLGQGFLICFSDKSLADGNTVSLDTTV